MKTPDGCGHSDPCGGLLLLGNSSRALALDWAEFAWAYVNGELDPRQTPPFPERSTLFPGRTTTLNDAGFLRYDGAPVTDAVSAAPPPSAQPQSSDLFLN